MKDVGTVKSETAVDEVATMEIEGAPDKITSIAQISDNREANETEGRDDGGSLEETTRGEDNAREGFSTKPTKPSPSRKQRSGSISQGRRSSQDAKQGPYQGRPGPFPHHGGARNPHNGPSYHPHPPYGYHPGPVGAPHDPYRGGPPPHPHPHFHQAPPFGAPPPGSFHPGAPPPFHPSMQNGPGYRVPQYPPSSHPYPGFHPGHHQSNAYPPASDSSNASSRSKGSKASSGPSKKRTISGVHVESTGSQDMSSYPFRRTGSSASTSSTVTAGNNTSADTPCLTEDSPQQRPRTMNSANLFEDADHLSQMHQHRRNNSSASTASSLSVGGFSLSSYDRPRDGRNYEDSVLTKASPKKRKSNGSSLSGVHHRITSNSSHSVDVAGAPSRFQKLSMDDASSKPPSGAAEVHRREANSRNLFLSLSTSPINCEEEGSAVDVDATPSVKNTKKAAGSLVHDNSFDRGGDTPTPTEAMADRDMMTNESMLNQHLRSQSFTPLSHLANGSENGRESVASPTMNSQGFSAIAPQLSWSIAGDAPSLADLTDWEEEIQSSKSHDEHKRDNSIHSKGSFGMTSGVLSPTCDIAMNMEGGHVESTPLPMMLSHAVSSEERENVMKVNPLFSGFPDSGSRGGSAQFGDAEHIHHLFLTNGGRGSSSKGNQQMRPPTWSSDFVRKPMPPTPVYSDNHEDGFGRSPLNIDGHMEFFPNNMFGHGMSNDRVRNLRGRVHPAGLPMPLQMPQQAMSHHHHHNLTSPIGIGGSNGKPTMWGGLHSPHHMPQVDLNSSKRKCVPLKPPIPSKFQGDIDKVKLTRVPEFVSLVNFPNHMSQKQSANLPEGMRCCVMCGQACPCSAGNKNKKDKKSKEGGLAPRNSNTQDAAKDKQNDGYAIIPTQNKGLCTMCDVNVWVVTQSGLEIKWCKGCKNFRPWAAFGDKGLATKCLRCRERQREKYALQKEEKERKRIMAKGATVKA